MKSNFVLGHELLHAWSFEFTDLSQSPDFGNRLAREKLAVTFENYLRAKAEETNMREVYTLGQPQHIFALESTSVERFKNFKLPAANNMRSSPAFKYERALQRDVDNTFMKRPIIPIKTIDTRKQKL